MRIAWAVAAIFIARFAVAAWFDPAGNGDIAWQHWLGVRILDSGTIPNALGPEAFTAPGAAWVPQEWALSVAVALAVGKPGFILLVAATTLATIAVLFFTALSARRLGASSVAAAVAVACVGFSMLESYGIRAQVFGWAMLSVVMFLLRSEAGRAKWWIVPVVALWANLHASVLLAPALAALWTLGTALQVRGLTPAVREYALLTLACCGAVFLTPFGYHLPLYVLQLLHSPIRTVIQEWQPSSLASASFRMGALPLIAGLCILGVPRSRRCAEVLIFAAIAWLAFAAVRNVPVCAIVIAPLVAERLSKYLPERARINTIFSERPVLAILYCGTFVAALLSGTALASSAEFRRGDLPQAAIARLAAIPGTHRLYCEDFAWCSLGLSHANLREFIDGRCDPFPLPVWKEYVAIAHANGPWRTLLVRRGVDAVLADRKHPLARALQSWRSWKLVYADDRFRLFVRRSGSASGQK